MTHEGMLKIPSYLKGLVETRARADAYALRLERLQVELQEQLGRAKRDRESCDNLIRAYNSALDPNTITPISAWRGRYGSRGARVDALRAFVRGAYPEPVTTLEAAWHIMAKFEVDFVSNEQRENWKKNAIRNPLRGMRDRGEVEQLEPEGPPDGATPASWRWVPKEERDALSASASEA
jgi:hypothetical protein